MGDTYTLQDVVDQGISGNRVFPNQRDILVFDESTDPGESFPWAPAVYRLLYNTFRDEHRGRTINGEWRYSENPEEDADDLILSLQPNEENIEYLLEQELAEQITEEEYEYGQQLIEAGREARKEQEDAEYKIQELRPYLEELEESIDFWRDCLEVMETDWRMKVVVGLGKVWNGLVANMLGEEYRVPAGKEERKEALEKDEALAEDTRDMISRLEGRIEGCEAMKVLGEMAGDQIEKAVPYDDGYLRPTEEAETILDIANDKQLLNDGVHTWNQWLAYARGVVQRDRALGHRSNYVGGTIDYGHFGEQKLSDFMQEIVEHPEITDDDLENVVQLFI